MRREIPFHLPLKVLHLFNFPLKFWSLSQWRETFFVTKSTFSFLHWFPAAPGRSGSGAPRRFRCWEVVSSLLWTSCFTVTVLLKTCSSKEVCSLQSVSLPGRYGTLLPWRRTDCSHLLQPFLAVMFFHNILSGPTVPVLLQDSHSNAFPESDSFPVHNTVCRQNVWRSHLWFLHVTRV